MISWLTPHVLHRIGAQIGGTDNVKLFVDYPPRTRPWPLQGTVTAWAGSIDQKLLNSVLAPSSVKAECTLQASLSNKDWTVRYEYCTQTQMLEYVFILPHCTLEVREDFNAIATKGTPDNVLWPFVDVVHGEARARVLGEEMPYTALESNLLLTLFGLGKTSPSLSDSYAMKVGIWFLHGLGIKGVFMPAHIGVRTFFYFFRSP